MCVICAGEGGADLLVEARALALIVDVVDLELEYLSPFKVVLGGKRSHKGGVQAVLQT
eukprot:SAG11_NODE_27_length_23309_cov_10.579362_8_plen_58_part_00